MVNCPIVGLHWNTVVTCMMTTGVYHRQQVKSNNSIIERNQKLCHGITDIIRANLGSEFVVANTLAKWKKVGAI